MDFRHTAKREGLIIELMTFMANHVFSVEKNCGERCKVLIIHHSMRSIRRVRHVLELTLRRASTRIAFGKTIAEWISFRRDIAHSWFEIEMARLLSLKSAGAGKRLGNREAKDSIGASKCVAPQMARANTTRNSAAWACPMIRRMRPSSLSLAFCGWPMALTSSSCRALGSSGSQNM